MGAGEAEHSCHPAMTDIPRVSGNQKRPKKKQKKKKRKIKKNKQKNKKETNKNTNKKQKKDGYIYIYIYITLQFFNRRFLMLLIPNRLLPFHSSQQSHTKFFKVNCLQKTNKGFVLYFIDKKKSKVINDK